MCIYFRIDKIQKRSGLSYRYFLLDLNFKHSFERNNQNTSFLYALRLISVDRFTAEIHSFEYRSCFIPYHFYSKSGKKRILLEFSTPVETYWSLSTETFGTYTQDAAKTFMLTFKLQSVHSFWL